MFQVILSALAFLLLPSIFLVKKWLSPPSKRLPPSPPKLPILGNLHQIGLRPHRSLHSLAQRHGPLMLLKFGSKPVLVASSADVAQEIMKGHDLIFSDRPRLSISYKLLYQWRDISSAPYGEYWRKVRSLSVLNLLSNKRVQSFRKVREEEVGNLVEKIRQRSSMSLPFNLSEMLLSLTNDVICRVAVGKKYGAGEEGRGLKELLEEFMELLGSFTVGDFIPWLSWINCANGFDRRLDKFFKELDGLLEGVVKEHMDRFKLDKDEEQKDFVDVLLQLQREDLGLSTTSIKAVLLSMFLGGTDTSYSVLEWAMTELMRHPQVMEQLQKEVRGIGSGKPEIKEADMEKMHYLKAVINETLRLHPPIPLLVPRASTQDVKIKGYDIAAGTMVFTNAWSIGRDPDIWEQPEEFRPERFLENGGDFKDRHDFSMVPFGAGRRGCPGIVFATPINELVLANLVYNFDWALPGGGSGVDLDTTECPGVVLHRQHPLLVAATQTNIAQK